MTSGRPRTSLNETIQRYYDAAQLRDKLLGVLGEDLNNVCPEAMNQLQQQCPGAVHRVELNQIIIDVPRVNDEGVDSYTFNFFRPLLWGLAGWAVAGPPVQNVPPGKVVQDEEDVEKARLQFMNKAVERIGDVPVATVGVGVIIETFAMGTGSYEAGRQGENAAEYIMGEPPAEAAPAVPPEAAPAVPPEAPGEVANLTAQDQRAVQSLQEQIAEHQQKLADYINNPDAFDNQGFLQNAPTPENSPKHHRRPSPAPGE